MAPRYFGLTDEQYDVILSMPDPDDFLMHLGTPHEGNTPHSGRYSWGSGQHPFQRYAGFVEEDRKLKEEGLTEAERAARHLISVEHYRARISYISAVEKDTMRTQCAVLKDQGLSNVAIAKKLGISEGSVRNYLKPSDAVREEIALSTVQAIRDTLEGKDFRGNDIVFVDVGKGTGARMNVPEQRVTNAVYILKDYGYELYPMHIKTADKQYTNTLVLARPGISKQYCYQHLDEMGEMNVRSEDGGKSYEPIKPPVEIAQSRIYIRYDDDDKNGLGDGQSGTLRDGIIELRRGVPDLDLGEAKYAQVRIAVEGGLYLKGMAMYADDLPPGVDIRFNSNKKRGTPINKVLKEQDISDDTGNPFGATIREQSTLRAVQTTYIDPKTGERRQSALNIVNEEGDWETWSRNLASQFLSKQPVLIAKKQLELNVMSKQKEYEDIMAITNPVLRRTMLENFAGECDTASVHLKAAALPRQQTHVILPLPGIRKDEVYAPNYDDGEEVILVRYPHSGIFEIPRLTVNNRSRTAKRIIGDARDAVGIHPEAAAQLSGADFDGDTVLVIPTRNLNLRSAQPLKGLIGFDPKTAYATTEEERESGKVSYIKTKDQRSREMGIITNLITDMQVSGKATEEELERAVRHSMVVVDAYKHKLDYKRSERENRISELKAKYQAPSAKELEANPNKRPGGAKTIFSRASAEIQVPKRKGSGKPDPETGRMVYRLDPDRFEEKIKLLTDKNGKPILDEKGKKQWIHTGIIVERTQASTRMAEATDAYELTSGGSRDNPGHTNEAVYAEYANTMKAMANRARKESISIKTPPWNRSAEKAYTAEVASLREKVNRRYQMKPLERKAQAATQAEMRIFDSENPDTDKEDRKKRRARILKKNRSIYGADREDFKLTRREWEAIQLGAVSATMQKEIFKMCDQEQLRQLAMPKDRPAMSKADVSRARALMRSGYSSAEIAKLFGISTTTLHTYLYDKKD